MQNLLILKDDVTVIAAILKFKTVTKGIFRDVTALGWIDSHSSFPKKSASAFLFQVPVLYVIMLKVF